MKMRALAGLVGLMGALAACGPSAPITPPALTPAETPNVTPAPDTPAPTISADKLAPIAIRIPAIGVDGQDVRSMGLEPDHSLQVPPVSEPMVAGWYKGSPVPGNPGSSVVIGHVDGNHKKGIFWGLSKLKVGDKIYVDRSDGQTAEFRVKSLGKYCKEAANCTGVEKPFPTSLVYSNQPESELHLITCGGRYQASTKNYLENWLVISTLVGMTPMHGIDATH